MSEPADSFATPADRLHAAIDDRSALVGVIGLGYVGLPLARAFVDRGFTVLGFDTDPAKPAALNAGRSYIQHISSTQVGAWLATGRFSATDDLSLLGRPDVLLICVPTPLTDSRDPDLQYVEATARQIAAALRPGQLVVLESTTYPGTTREVVAPLLAASGLALGRDMFLAYSPEREDPGNPRYTASNIPKVVGGIDRVSGDLAERLYAEVVVATVRVSSCEAAEACKILENTYRAVNIALVNELKTLFDRLGIDVWEVIDAAKTKPFGFQAFYPGPGWGGHCIPIDPFYLSWLARRQGGATRFIELAGEINTNMPHYVVDKLTAALNDRGKPVRGSRICLLGVAYKKDVDDARETPAFVIYRLLAERGAVLTYSDPHVPRLPRMRDHPLPDLASETLTSEFLAQQDAVVIVTDHTAFDYEAIVAHAPLIIDTRNATGGLAGGQGKVYRA